MPIDYERFNDAQLLKILSSFGDPAHIRILYLSTYSPDYVRTRSLLEVFRRNRVRVSTLWATSPVLRHLWVFVRALRRLRECDVVFLAFRGHETLPLLRLITRKPIIFDSFVSLYDTACFDRKLFKPASFIGRMLKRYDIFLCRIADAVLVDTLSHCRYFREEFRAKNVSYLYLECERCLFKPLDVRRDPAIFRVFWYGNCWPLQGVEIILEAAHILKEDKEIRFTLAGPIRKKYKRLLRQAQMSAFEFLDFIPYRLLPLEIAKSDVCLGGHFSGIDKAARVIPSKAFQCIACGKPTILGDNAANRELFSPGPQVYFVPMNSPFALAQAIRKIKEARCLV